MISARRFAPILATAGAIILAQQVADLIPALIATDMQVAQSRLQLFAGLGSRGPALVTADVFLVWATISLAHRGGIRVVGGVHLALGVLALVAVPLLMRDAGAVVYQVGTGIATYRAVVIRLLLFLLTFGVGGLLAGRTLRTL